MKRGFSLTEIILAIAIFGLFVTALTGVYFYGEENSLLVVNRNRALFLADQGIEATRSIRDADFANLVNGTYGLATTGGVWAFSGSSDTTDLYTREVTISDYDTDVKEVESRITWQQNGQRTGEVVLTSLLSFWQEVVSLGGDWSVPLLNDTVDIIGGTNGWKIDSNDTHAYLVRTTNDGTVADFVSFDINDPTNVTEEDAIILAGQLRDVVIDGDYAYVSSTENNPEIIVVDISDPANLSTADTFNLTGNQNMQGLIVDGNYLYATRDSSSTELVIFDITDPTNISLSGTLNLSSRYREVYVSGNFAYLAGDPNTAELSVVNISVPAAPVQVATLDLSGASNGITIDGYGNYVFLGRASGELSIINVSNPLAPSVTGSVDPGAIIRDIAAVSSLDYVFLAGDSNNNELRIYDVSTPSTPTLVGSYDSGGNDFNGVSYNGTGDFVVVASEENAAELTVISSQ